MRKNFLTEEVVTPVCGLPREMEESPCLEVFKREGCGTKGHGLMVDFVVLGLS